MMMSPPHLAASLTGCSDRLRQRFGDRLRFVRLFGSWARGEAHADSDIDVAIVISGLTRDEWREAINLATQDGDSTGVFLSPFVMSSERFDELLRRERRIAGDILREGIVV